MALWMARLMNMFGQLWELFKSRGEKKYYYSYNCSIPFHSLPAMCASYYTLSLYRIKLCLLVISVPARVYGPVNHMDVPPCG